MGWRMFQDPCHKRSLLIGSQARSLVEIRLFYLPVRRIQNSFIRREEKQIICHLSLGATITIRQSGKTRLAKVVGNLLFFIFFALFLKPLSRLALRNHLCQPSTSCIWIERAFTQQTIDQRSYLIQTRPIQSSTSSLHHAKTL